MLPPSPAGPACCVKKKKCPLRSILAFFPTHFPSVTSRCMSCHSREVACVCSVPLEYLMHTPSPLTGSTQPLASLQSQASQTDMQRGCTKKEHCSASWPRLIFSSTASPHIFGPVPPYAMSCNTTSDKEVPLGSWGARHQGPPSLLVRKPQAVGAEWKTDPAWESSLRHLKGRIF